MWELNHKESWALKNWCDAFELWCWRRLLKVPWTARRSNQSILKEINHDYSLEGLMLMLQYFGHPMRTADSLEKTLMLGKIEGKRRRGWQRMRWLDSISNSMDMYLSKLQETVKDRAVWHAAVHGVTRSWARLSNWTTVLQYSQRDQTQKHEIQNDYMATCKKMLDRTVQSGHECWRNSKRKDYWRWTYSVKASFRDRP